MSGGRRRRPDAAELRRWIAAAGAQLGDAPLKRSLAGLSAGERTTLDEDWGTWRHGGQAEPPGEWRTWLNLAGRGFGKTRAGAEWVWARVREAGTVTSDRPLRIALVAASVDEVAKVMVEGESGLLACARRGEEVLWQRSRGELVFPSGALAQAFSGGHPARLRGPQHHFAWCDELAKWRYPAAAWSNLRLGMRLGTRPRILVTTTPAPVAALKGIAAAPDTAVTSGRTFDNPHLPADYLAAMRAQFGGTRIGRQELEGELLEDFEGALWTRRLIESCRVSLPGTGRWQAAGLTEGEARQTPWPAGNPLDHASHGHEQVRMSPGHSQPCRGHDVPAHPRAGEDWKRIVVGVDPPASAEGDACGIVVCGLGGDGAGYVLSDASVAGLTPEGWARKVAAAAEAWAADRVVAEANNGGRMVETVLRGASLTLPLRLVHAGAGKSARAEPVSTLFEGGRARFAGAFPELEDQLCGMLVGGGYAGPGRSPDRADAMVWAMTELMLRPAQAEPRVRAL